MSTTFFAICDEDGFILQEGGHTLVYTTKESAVIKRDSLKSPKYYHIEQVTIESEDW